MKDVHFNKPLPRLTICSTMPSDKVVIGQDEKRHRALPSTFVEKVDFQALSRPIKTHQKTVDVKRDNASHLDVLEHWELNHFGHRDSK